MKKNVTVYYRKLDRDNSDFPHITFEEAINDALRSVSGDWKDRSMNTGRDSILFTNIFRSVNPGTYGDVCAFSHAQIPLMGVAPLC